MRESKSVGQQQYGGECTFPLMEVTPTFPSLENFSYFEVSTCYIACGHRFSLICYLTLNVVQAPIDVAMHTCIT